MKEKARRREKWFGRQGSEGSSKPETTDSKQPEEVPEVSLAAS